MTLKTTKTPVENHHLQIFSGFYVELGGCNQLKPRTHHKHINSSTASVFLVKLDCEECFHLALTNDLDVPSSSSGWAGGHAPLS